MAALGWIKRVGSSVDRRSVNAAVARLTYGLVAFVGIAAGIFTLGALRTAGLATATGVLLLREQLFPSLALKSRNQRALLALRMFVGFFVLVIIGALAIDLLRALTG
jgi:hypothetical protein